MKPFFLRGEAELWLSLHSTSHTVPQTRPCRPNRKTFPWPDEMIQSKFIPTSIEGKKEKNKSQSILDDITPNKTVHNVYHSIQKGW